MKNPFFKIFVVEDDPWYQKLLQHHLSLNPDHEVQLFSDGKTFLKHLNQRPDVVTLDYKLPDISGSDLLNQIKSAYPEIEVLIISEQSNIETAVTLLKNGAYDYITKTDDIRDKLLNVIQHIKKNRTLESTIEHLQSEVEKKYDFQNSILGTSDSMKQVFRLIEKACTNNISVTIQGETGTGKELVAKAIHYNSNRKKQPFVAVNMSAIPSELAESELFGHEKGSFTGANERHLGKFEQADGGTLFLDEIGEMPATLQPKILRALQEKEIVRVGGTKPIKFDCRIITATHRDLNEEIQNGNFREDLFYRLHGLPIQLPPLRVRGNDIIQLAKFFCAQFCQDNNMEPKTFTKPALQKLLAYGYPGNIRELKSLVELAVVMADNSEITEADISFTRQDTVADMLEESMTLKAYDLKIVKLYLQNHNDDIKKVAQLLNIGQSTIYRMLKEDGS